MARTRQPTHRPTDGAPGMMGRRFRLSGLEERRKLKELEGTNPKPPAPHRGPLVLTHTHTHTQRTRTLSLTHIHTMFSVPQTTPKYPRCVCGEIEAIGFPLRP